MSVGDYDVVKAVLERLGTLEWWQVAIKPAKPFAFGTVDGTPIFGLPGNPVSSHVSFELFARPALRRMMGHAVVDRPVVARSRVRRSASGRRSAAPRPGPGHLRGRPYVVVRSGAQASNVLSGMAAANGLALLPDGDGVEGEPVDVMLC